MCLMACMRLRMKDVDFDRRVIIVCDGDRDGGTASPLDALQALHI
jgi:hypothetical protein